MCRYPSFLPGVGLGQRPLRYAPFMSDTDPHDASADETDEADGGPAPSSDADDQPDDTGETGHLDDLAGGDAAPPPDA